MTTYLEWSGGTGPNGEFNVSDVATITLTPGMVATIRVQRDGADIPGAVSLPLAASLDYLITAQDSGKTLSARLQGEKVMATTDSITVALIEAGSIGKPSPTPGGRLLTQADIRAPILYTGTEPGIFTLPADLALPYEIELIRGESAPGVSAGWVSVSAAPGVFIDGVEAASVAVSNAFGSIALQGLTANKYRVVQ